MTGKSMRAAPYAPTPDSALPMEWSARTWATFKSDGFGTPCLCTWMPSPAKMAYSSCIRVT
eukprot:scaffold98214_cov31-Tisochrysis_lutea.AAC.2